MDLSIGFRFGNVILPISISVSVIPSAFSILVFGQEAAFSVNTTMAALSLYLSLSHFKVWGSMEFIAKSGQTHRKPKIERMRENG
jgi:hypothetical protein